MGRSSCHGQGASCAQADGHQPEDGRPQFHGESAQVDVQIYSTAIRASFLATLNGKDITARFAGNRACRSSICTETAFLNKIDGLSEGRNVVRMRVKGWDGQTSQAQAVFFWTPAGSLTGGVGTAVPGIFQPNYTFTTLQPGGYQSTLDPWFKITSNAVGTVPRTYPRSPIQCMYRVYLLVEIDRRSLDEISSTCLYSRDVNAALGAIPSTSFAVFGSIAGVNADWSNLNAGAIGGSDYRKVGDQEAPWGYMMVGIGKAPWGTALESYNTGYERFGCGTGADSGSAHRERARHV